MHKNKWKPVKLTDLIAKKEKVDAVVSCINLNHKTKKKLTSLSKKYKMSRSAVIRILIEGVT